MKRNDLTSDFSFPASSQIDEALLPLHQFIAELTEAAAGFEDEGIRMEMQSMGIEMPLTLDIASREDGSLAIGAGPPLYYVETSIEQIHHPVKFLITKDDSKQ
jgi:hypothetical protein